MSGFVHPGLPGPLLRRGPRPLLLHLTLAMLRSASSVSGLPSWSSVWPAMSAVLRATAPGHADDPGDIRAADPPEPAAPDLQALFQAAAQRDAALIRGIAAYRRHPAQRRLADPQAIWTEGESRLLDYGAALPAGAPAVLFVPSLVNRAYVLDLAEGRSLLRWLARQGLRPLLLDWGWPGPAERGFTLTDYVAGRLERAMAAAAAVTADRPVLAGYCMGGTLAVAAAQRRPDLLRALVLLAAPWDFWAGAPQLRDAAARILPFLEPAMSLSGTLSIDLLQTLFTLLDPHGVGDKYRAFARLDPASPRARLFVAIEDWLADGVPLAAPVAREVLSGWYGANSPAHGAWRIAGLAVQPAAIRLPAFVAAPARDRIVPPDSALALAHAIPGAVLHQPGAGHVGMIAGTTAERALWRPLRDWVAALPSTTGR
jgi:poly(3-hydroxyalkanoate) synthetase